jgi:inorganic pyrophosphatase
MATSFTVFVETPRGSAQKYKLDEQRRVLVLRKELPAGVAMPYDHGFVTGTRGGDGDPLDALVLSEHRGIAGSEVECRIIGAIAAQQRKDDDADMVRNDCLLAIPVHARWLGEITAIEQLPDRMLDDLEQFFVGYHRLEGVLFIPLRRLGPREAGALIAEHKHG